MTFTIETLSKTVKTGFMRRDRTSEPEAYRIMRDDGTSYGTYSAQDLAHAEARCDELNAAFRDVSLDQYSAELAENS